MTTPTVKNDPSSQKVDALNRYRDSTTGLWLDAPAPSSEAGSALATTATAVAASSLVLKASAGNLYGLSAATGGTAGWVMLFDDTAAPADGTVTPKRAWKVEANSSLEVGFQVPLRHLVGVTLVFSSTGPFTKTASATAFLAGEAV